MNAEIEAMRRALGNIDMGAIADTKRILEENSASVTIAMHVKREQDLMRAAAGRGGQRWQ